MINGGLCPFEIHPRAELAECVAGPGELLHGPVWLGGGVRSPKFIVSTGCPIAIPQHVKDRNTATEMLCGRSSIRLLKRKEPGKPLRLTREPQVGRRVGHLLSDLVEFGDRIVELFIAQMRF